MAALQALTFRAKLALALSAVALVVTSTIPLVLSVREQVAAGMGAATRSSVERLRQEVAASDQADALLKLERALNTDVAPAAEQLGAPRLARTAQVHERTSRMTRRGLLVVALTIVAVILAGRADVIGITYSAGIAGASGGTTDELSYEAKRAGKDRIYPGHLQVAA